MSFASDLRNELARIIPSKECCRKAELHALLITNGKEQLSAAEESQIIVSAENAATARKIYQLLKQTADIHATVSMETRKRFKKTKSYQVIADYGDDDSKISFLLPIKEGKNSINWSLLTKNCCKRAFLRGVFLSKGFVSKPESSYHLELVFNEEKEAVEIHKFLSKVGLKAGLTNRKLQSIIYLKDSEKIVDFLRMIEGSKSLLYFENVRIIKSMRNTVNRQVNCETANLAKSIEAAVRQTELMEKLVRSKTWGNLTPLQRELAELRLEYPEATLRELGDMLNTPLSKSGIAYHMRKLEKIAVSLNLH